MDIAQRAEFSSCTDLWRACSTLALGFGALDCQTRYRYLGALVLTMGYGWLDEWHQTFVPGRYGSLTDVGFNLMGAVIGMVIYTSWFSVDKRKE
jgi:VanZ family protein